MVRITEQRLQGLALRVLDDAIEQSRQQIVQRTIGLRLALAYLAASVDCERAPFDAFWAAMMLPNDTTRHVGLKKAQLRIRLELGVIDQNQYLADLTALPVRTKKGWR